MTNDEKITENSTIENGKIKEYTFLNQDWIHEVTRVVQGARAKDEDFRKATADYSLDLLYVIKDLPDKLKVAYQTDGLITLFVKLDKGVVQKLVIGTETPEEKVDFTVTSSYGTAKDIFNEILNPATAFINRHIKVEPMATVYKRPRFTAQSIIAGNMILKYARQVPTNYDFENVSNEVT